MLLRGIILPCLFLLMSCKPESTEQLVWSDEFDIDGAPDSTRWNFDLGSGVPAGWGNNEQQYYTRDNKNVRVENGKLIIEAHRDSMFNKSFTSSRLVSKTKADWRYARIEVKAKLPKGKGTWPAIWMLPTEPKFGVWPASGEIDIMEHVGFDPNVVHGTIHTESYNHLKQTQKEGKISVPQVDEEFHVYATDWSEKKFDFLVDGKVYYTFDRNPEDDFKGWPFDERFYLIMNLAVGGNWGGQQGIDQSIWPQRLEVDYVRVYSKKNEERDEVALSGN